MLAFLPLTAAELDALAVGRLADVAAHAATPALYGGLGFGADEEEDAEFGALTYASVACLLRAPLRLVAVAEVAGVVDSGDDFGSVVVPEVGWRQVASLFIDEPGAAALVAAAHAAAEGLTIDQAWEEPAVVALLAAADLLWHSAGELPLVRTALEE